MGHNTFTVGDEGKLGSRDEQCQPKGEGREEHCIWSDLGTPLCIRAGMPWEYVKLLEYWPCQIISPYIFSLCTLEESKFTHQTYK